MGGWSMGILWWIAFIITFPLRVLFCIPHWIVRPFSKELSWKIYEKNRLLQALDGWLI